jgi:type IV pilus assembly protein PilO
MGKMADISFMDSTPRSQKLALGIVMIGLVVCGFYVFVWKPIQNRIEMARAGVQQLRQENQHLTPQNPDRPEWQARIQELEKSLYGEHRDIQQEIGRVGLRNRVTGIAQHHQLEITYWQPEAIVEGAPDGIKKTPFQVQIEGGYHQVAKFFSRVLHLPDVFGISRFTISVTNDQTQKIHIQTNFVMTVLPPPWPGELPHMGHHVSNEDSQASGI